MRDADQILAAWEREHPGEDWRAHERRVDDAMVAALDRWLTARRTAARTGVRATEAQGTRP